MKLKNADEIYYFKQTMAIYIITKDYKDDSLKMVEKSKEAVFSMAKLVALDGDCVQAMYDLGIMYGAGFPTSMENGQRNYQQALYWLRKASEKGYASAKKYASLLE